MKIKKIHRNIAIALVVAVVVVVVLAGIHAFRRETFSQHPQIVPMHYRNLPGLPQSQQRIRMYNPSQCRRDNPSQRK